MVYMMWQTMNTDIDGHNVYRWNIIMNTLIQYVIGNVGQVDENN